MAQIAQAIVWTYARLIALLENNQAALERAILTINARQTSDELATQATRHENGRGWNSRDASFGGSLADWIGRGVKSRDQGGFGKEYGTCLTPRQRDGALRMVRKYWRQLLEEIALKGGQVSYKASKVAPHQEASIAQAELPQEEEPLTTQEQGLAEKVREIQGASTPEQREALIRQLVASVAGGVATQEVGAEDPGF